MFDFDDLEVAVPVGPDGTRSGGQGNAASGAGAGAGDGGGAGDGAQGAADGTAEAPEPAPPAEAQPPEPVAPAAEEPLPEPPARSLAGVRAQLAAGDAVGAERIAQELLDASPAPAGVQAYRLQKVRLQALLHPAYRPASKSGSLPAQALALARKLADEQPTDTSLPALLGRALSLDGKRREADALWERAAAKEGPDGEVRQLLRGLAVAEEEKKKGNAAFKDSQWEAACAAYTRAAEADAFRIDRELMAAVLGNRSAVHRKLALFDEALADAEESLWLSPTYVKARFRRALVLMQFERYPEALADLRTVKEREPSTAGLNDWLLRAEHWSGCKQKNHYAKLGAPMDATQEEIKRAHKRMALKWHPDKAVGSHSKEECEERFKAIQEAFEFLSCQDERQRDVYDFGRILQRQPLQPAPSSAGAAYAAKREPMPKQLVKMGFGTIKKGDGINTCMCCGEYAETYWDKKQHINVTDHPGFIDENALRKSKR